uniref:Uncharacterized protein n=1 Tax=Solanum tuberosum TaxID=4113 RepID=M1DG26_SOLTU
MVGGFKTAVSAFIVGGNNQPKNCSNDFFSNIAEFQQQKDKSRKGSPISDQNLETWSSIITLLDCAGLVVGSVSSNVLNRGRVQKRRHVTWELRDYRHVMMTCIKVIA